MIQAFGGGRDRLLEQEKVAFGFEFVAKFVGNMVHEAFIGEENKGAGL